MGTDIQKHEYSMGSKRWEKVSEPAKDFVRALLTVDPEKRPSALEALEHGRLFTNVGQNDM